MEFRIAHNPEENIPVIIGEGPIIEGDAKRLETILTQAGRDHYGNIPMYLNSPGGSVLAAFAMVEVMDKHEFSAYVSSNAICASACSFLTVGCRRWPARALAQLLDHSTGVAFDGCMRFFS
jgi:hypothetical protein